MTAQFVRFKILETVSLQEHERWLRLASEHREWLDNKRLMEYLIDDNAAYLIDGTPIIDGNHAHDQKAERAKTDFVHSIGGNVTAQQVAGSASTSVRGRRVKIMKRMTWPTIIGLFVGAYTAFVATCMWNWFAVRALNVPVISFPAMLGLIWLVQIVLPSRDDDVVKWDLLVTALEKCLPDDKRTTLSESLQEQASNVWAYALPMVIGKIFANTVTLILGFGLYVIIQ